MAPLPAPWADLPPASQRAPRNSPAGSAPSRNDSTSTSPSGKPPESGRSAVPCAGPCKDGRCSPTSLLAGTGGVLNWVLRHLNVHERPDGLGQLFDRKGFRQEGVRSGFQRGPAVLRRGQPADDDHRGQRQGRLGSNLADDGQTVHLRHHDVEQDQIRLVAFSGEQTTGTVRGSAHTQALLRQYFGHHPAVGPLVVDHQDRLLMHRTPRWFGIITSAPSLGGSTATAHCSRLTTRADRDATGVLAASRRADRGMRRGSGTKGAAVGAARPVPGSAAPDQGTGVNWKGWSKGE